MTDQEMRIAVAECCGWRYHGTTTSHGKVVPVGDNGDGVQVFMPDYPNDLNAMHEAEAVLESTWHDGRWHKYASLLNEIANPGPRMSREAEYWHLLRITAHQRCEAFLRTVGKWNE